MVGVTRVTTCPLPPGSYPVGEAEDERVVTLAGAWVAQTPVTNRDYAQFASSTGHPVAPSLTARLVSDVLADHPVVTVTLADAQDYADWAGGRLPTGDEWEAAARGPAGRTWPWGDSFAADRCNCDEAHWGGTTAVDAHPGGASWCGAWDMVGNVWEWVADAPDADGWRAIRGGCFLDTEWGVRASRRLAADPDRATPTTGFRVVWDRDREEVRS